MNTRQLTLVAVAVSFLTVGGWAQLFPASFYNDFPLGRQWVALDGPYNEHLVRDVGGLNLALGVALIAAAVWGTVMLQRVAAGASLLYTVPHFAYHAGHLGPYASGDRIALMLTLGFVVVAPIAVAASPDRKVQPGPSMP